MAVVVVVVVYNSNRLSSQSFRGPVQANLVVVTGRVLQEFSHSLPQLLQGNTIFGPILSVTVSYFYT
jgi:hypothetical protein